MSIGAAIEAEEACRKSAALDVSMLGDDELLEHVASLERSRSMLDAAAGHGLAELESRKLTVQRLGIATGSWAGRQGATSMGAGRRRTRVATKIRHHFPLIAEAWADGRLSTAHVEFLDKVANPRVIGDLAELSAELIALAESTIYERWKLHVASVVEHLDQDGGYRPEHDRERNRLFITPLFDGTYQLRGELVGVLGASLSEAVHREADRLFRSYREAASASNGSIEVPARSRLLAEALVNLVSAGGVSTAPAGHTPADVTIVVEDSDHDHAHTDDGGGLPRDEQLECRLCDPVIRRLVMAADGIPLDLGASVRLATPEQRRAVRRRDGGCVFPGCDCPARWSDLHHVRRSVDDGPTDISNLACLCRFHHGITHRAGWAMHATDDQWFWWTTPFGDSFWSQRDGRQRLGPAPP